jgi:predicted methyltransferase
MTFMLRHAYIRLPRAATLAFLVLAIAGRADAQARTGSGGGGMPPRDEWQRVPEILAAMGAIEGKHVADIAAGKGYLTRPLARKVGGAGRVFAVELGAPEREALEKLARDSFPNVAVIEGTPTDPRLPPNLDAAVVLNSYHEFTDYRAMLEGIRRALRPGGLLVLVDNNAAESTESREWQASHHGLAPRFVEAELREAGFEIAERRDDFIVGPFAQWMFIARRPAGP